MAYETTGYTDREQRDAEYWRLVDEEGVSVRTLERYTTHSDLPEDGEEIPDKWKNWNTSIIYVLGRRIETLPPVVAEAEAVLAEIGTEVPLTEEGASEMIAEGGNTNELGQQSVDSIPSGFRGPVVIPDESDDSSQRPDPAVDEDIL